MSYGLPVVITKVGGLPEAARDYEGAIFVPPQDPVALRETFSQVGRLRGKRFIEPYSWERTVSGFDKLFVDLAQDKVEIREYIQDVN
jgi:glycosyltransferase involved in cell wall biosynthesis